MINLILFKPAMAPYFYLLICHVIPDLIGRELINSSVKRIKSSRNLFKIVILIS